MFASQRSSVLREYQAGARTGTGAGAAGDNRIDRHQLDDITVQRYNIPMNIIESYLKNTNKTKYRLSKESGIPYSTVSDICSGRTPLNRCSAETVYRLSRAMGVSCDDIIASACAKAHEYVSGTYDKGDIMDGLRSLSSCFWDTDISRLDIEKNKDFIITRLYTKGGMRGINFVHRIYADDDVIHAAKVRRDLNPIVANYLSKKYGIRRSDMAYYRMEDMGGRTLWNH